MTSSNVQKFMFSMIALALLMGALAVSSSSTAAQETTNPVGVTGGNTILKPTKQMIRKLKRAKVRVRPTGAATGGLRKLVFPVTGGRIEESDGKLAGVIRNLDSGLSIDYEKSTPALFAKSDPKVQEKEMTLKYPVVDFEKGMSWKLTRARIKLFKLTNIEYRVGNDPEAPPIRIRAKAKLTKRGAKLLGKRVGVNVKKGNTFGIIGVLVSFAGGDGQGGGIFN